MPAPYQLYCLGAPKLLSPGGSELGLRTRKHLALLVYLAVDPVSLHRRERLLDLLWPTSLDSARGSLATGLSMIRARLGREAVETDRHHVRLAAGRLVVDLERLEAGDVVGDEFTPPLEVDGFLSGFEVPDAPEFGIWRDAQHARLLPAIKAGLIRLADLARRTADARALGRYADRLLRIDDLAEEGIRARMEASALSGDRISAIRVYDEWAAKLERELGATPPPLLEGMALRLRRRGWDRPVTPIPTVRTEQWQNRPFIGRKREYRVLYETWERVAQAEPRHVLLQGESGVGKTTLADRLATAAGLEAATVSRVRCFELERGIPYAAIGGVLAPLLDRPGAAATSPEALAELARVIPEVRTRYANLPPPIETPGESARIRFAEAALELLNALMDEHPVVLTVDDFHLADEASLSVLHLLMRRTANRPFMVMLATTEDSSEGSANGARIRAGAQDLGLTVLEVEPMGEQDRVQLLEALIQDLQTKPTRTEQRAIMAAAGGYPMAIELMLRDWEEHGSQSLALSLGAITPDVTGDLDLKYRSLAERITQSLDPTARTVLQMAAILDRRLNDLEMYRLVDLSPGQAITGLAELSRRRALRDTGGGLEFVNPSVRAHSYMTTPISLRRLLHHNVSGILLERHNRSATVPGLELAWHCVRGGRSEDAGPHLLRGARQAIDTGAPHEAELALTSGMPLLENVSREEGFLILAEAFREMNRDQEIISCLSNAPGWSSAERKARALLLSLEVQQHSLLHHAGDTASQVVRLIDLLTHTQFPSVKAGALQLCATACEWLDDKAHARRAWEIAEQSAPVFDQPQDALRWCLARAMLSYQLRLLPVCRQLITEAAELTRQSGIKSSLGVAVCSGLGVICCCTGEYGEALKHFMACDRLLTSIANDRRIANNSANVALCHCRLGRYDLQLEWSRRAMAWSKPDIVYLRGLTYTAFAQTMLGQTADALRTTQLALRLYRPEQSAVLYQWNVLAAADVYDLCGRSQQASRLAIAGTADAFRNPQSLGILGKHTRWIAKLCTLGFIARAEALDRVQEAERRHGQSDALDRVEILCALRLLGALDKDKGHELESALAHLPAAIRTTLQLQQFLPALGDTPNSGSFDHLSANHLRRVAP